MKLIYSLMSVLGKPTKNEIRKKERKREREREREEQLCARPTLRWQEVKYFNNSSI